MSPVNGGPININMSPVYGGPISVTMSPEYGGPIRVTVSPVYGVPSGSLWLQYTRVSSEHYVTRIRGPIRVTMSPLRPVTSGLICHQHTGSHNGHCVINIRGPIRVTVSPIYDPIRVSMSPIYEVPSGTSLEYCSEELCRSFSSLCVSWLHQWRSLGHFPTAVCLTKVPCTGGTLRGRPIGSLSCQVSTLVGHSEVNQLVVYRGNTSSHVLYRRPLAHSATAHCMIHCMTRNMTCSNWYNVVQTFLSITFAGF